MWTEGIVESTTLGLGRELGLQVLIVRGEGTVFSCCCMGDAG